MISLKGAEITSLYIMLKKREEELDENQSSVLRGIEAFLYENLSVQEIENIETLYAGKDPVVMFTEI
ncbi:MAG: hypothetical protein JEY99_00350 [Spirochaetales bacterium]|nr:hypothetical protein [Spirochaetales bacterium]